VHTDLKNTPSHTNKLCFSEVRYNQKLEIIFRKARTEKILGFLGN